MQHFMPHEATLVHRRIYSNSHWLTEMFTHRGEKVHWIGFKHKIRSAGKEIPFGQQPSQTRFTPSELRSKNSRQFLIWTISQVRGQRSNTRRSAACRRWSCWGDSAARGHPSQRQSRRPWGRNRVCRPQHFRSPSVHRWATFQRGLLRRSRRSPRGRIPFH